MRGGVGSWRWRLCRRVGDGDGVLLWWNECLSFIVCCGVLDVVLDGGLGWKGREGNWLNTPSGLVSSIDNVFEDYSVLFFWFDAWDRVDGHGDAEVNGNVDTRLS